MLYLAFRLLLNAPVEAVVLDVIVIVVAVLDTVEKIEIEVVDPASFKLLFEDLIPVLKGMDAPCRKLCGDGKSVSRISLYDGFLHYLLGVAAVVYICGIEIRKSCVKITVDHLADLIDIDLSVSLRKSHKAETYLGHL